MWLCVSGSELFAEISLILFSAWPLKCLQSFFYSTDRWHSPSVTSENWKMFCHCPTLQELENVLTLSHTSGLENVLTLSNTSGTGKCFDMSHTSGIYKMFWHCPTLQELENVSTCPTLQELENILTCPMLQELENVLTCPMLQELENVLTLSHTPSLTFHLPSSNLCRNLSRHWRDTCCLLVSVNWNHPHMSHSVSTLRKSGEKFKY